MISIEVKDPTWTNHIRTLYRDRGDGHSGFTNLTFSQVDVGGYETCKFQIPLTSPYESNQLLPYCSIDVWTNRQKVWQGRILRPLQYNSGGYLEVECEGIGLAFGRSNIATGFWNNNAPHTIYQDIVQHYADINLLNSDISEIQTAGNGYLISNRTYQEVAFSQVFNEVANFGFDDYTSGCWGVDSGAKANWISDPGNIFYWRKRDLTNVAYKLPYAWLDSCSIILDMSNFANNVRARYSATAYSDIGVSSSNAAALASQALYTPGHKQWAALDISNANNTATAADAAQVGNVFISRYAAPWPKGEIVLGENFLRYSGELALTDVRACMAVQIPGLTMARPDLLGTVTDQTVFWVKRSSYDDESFTMTLTLNDYPDNSAVMVSRLSGITTGI